MHKSYRVHAKRYSHWVLSDEGKYIHVTESLLAVKDAWYSFEEEISIKNTAFVIMDPWIDWPDENLNLYYGSITEKKLLPLIKKAAKAGHPVLILTEAPPRPHNTEIDANLAEMAKREEATILYHGDYNSDDFAKYLQERDIDTLIYTGYASNLCVLSRGMGIVPMSGKGLRIYFVPKASAAMEREDTWESGIVHEITSLIISQASAKNLDLEELLSKLS